MNNNNFHETSYHLHEQSYHDVNLAADLELYDNWFEKGTVDVWRHIRMLENIDPFLKQYPGADWLTVGDGRYGTSAIYINKKGSKALATDLDVSLLKIAKDKNWISDYKYANGEALPFDDNAFDFAFCKEAYHHFPRAYAGIYEMLRVAKKAVVLVEPVDWLPSPVPRRLLQLIKHSLKKIAGLSIAHPDTGSFEPSGNYVFTIAPREIQKIALGLQLPCVAYKKFHDVYINGVEQEKAVQNSPLFKRVKNKIMKNKIMTNLGLSTCNRIAAALFKELPPVALLNDLKALGFIIVPLPKNPYL